MLKYWLEAKLSTLQQNTSEGSALEERTKSVMTDIGHLGSAEAGTGLVWVGSSPGALGAQGPAEGSAERLSWLS